VTDASARIYWLGEDQFAKGNYLAAVQLWRHALLQLPKTAAADPVRHALVLRMAYGQLAAAETSGVAGPAADGVQMLERYLTRHEALFGETDLAKQERGQVYEILYELEERAEVEETPTEVASSEPEATESEPEPEATESEPETAPTTGDGDAEFVRQVDVDLSNEDPQTVRERLESDFSDATAGLVFGAYGIAPLHGPRPLLRVRSAAWADGEPRQMRARNVARAMAEQVREPLLSCYLDAIARQGSVPAFVSVRLEDKEDYVSVALTDGSLLDGYGDVCLAERLSKLDAPQGTDLEVELVFFVQGARYAQEWDGHGLGHEIELLAGAMIGNGPPKRRGGRSLPPIDAFAK